MIKLVFVTDEKDVIGTSSLEGYDYEQRVASWPEGLAKEIDDIFACDNIVVGRVTYPLCSGYFSKCENFYVMSKNPPLEIVNNEDVQVIKDSSYLIDRYKDSEDSLVVAGGKAIWEMFLPYASELVIALCDEPLVGDVVFDTWKGMDKTVDRITNWNGGKTVYYRMG